MNGPHLPDVGTVEGWTPAHEQMLQKLAEKGRLADFCVWPPPPRVAYERNVIHPQVVVEDRETGERRVVPLWRAVPLVPLATKEGDP